MAGETLEEMTRLRDKALSRAADLNGFRKHWRGMYNDMVRKFDAAQAHAWEMEKGRDEARAILNVLQGRHQIASIAVASGLRPDATLDELYEHLAELRDG